MSDNPSRSSVLNRFRIEALPLSFHDVGVHNFHEVDSMLKRLAEVTDSPPALMVIPRIPEEHQPNKKEFSSWLQKKKAEGNELFCHGWSHHIDESLERSVPGHLQNLVANREAEFAGLANRELCVLLSTALQAFESLGCGVPAGFVPPAWFAPNSMVDQCVRQGLASYEQRFFIWDLRGKSRKKHFSFPLSLFGDSRLAFDLSTRGAAFFTGRFRKTAVRMALHPVDFSDEERCSAVLRLIELLLRDKSACSYSRWLAPSVI